MDNSSNVKADQMTTMMRSSFEFPSNSFKPTWRNRMSGQNFDGVSRVQNNPVKDSKQNSSGFTMNSTLFDGTGWVPEKTLHSDQMRTIYRNQFN